MYRDPTRTAPLHLETLAVSAGRPHGPGQPLNQPPVLASAFVAGDGHGYSRRANPGWEAFERALGALEGGAAVCFGSGMAAAAAVADRLGRGARVLVADSAHVEVRAMLADRSARGAIAVEPVDPLDTAGLVRAVGRADVLWLDAIANPNLDVPDLDLICAAARRQGTRTVVDSTMATPMALRPLELGADVVLHSATKYIGGHSDLLLGAAVVRDRKEAAALAERRALDGAVPGTMEAWLATRGLRTLPLRIDRGSTSAGTLAGRLVAHHAVERVRYPGLPGDPTHEAARRLLGAFGAVLSFELDDAARADALCDAVELITHAGSLGGVETLIERQARWHAEPRVPAGLLRLSVGCEHPDDLWRDLSRALDAV